MIKVEPLEEFAARHGEFVEIGNGVRLFEDGAIASETGIEDIPTRREPPDDPVEVLRLRRRFVEAKDRSRVESYSDFAKRHGGNPVKQDGRFLFPDGAYCDSSTMVRTEQPGDMYSQLLARKTYVEAKLRIEIESFNQFKNSCIQQNQFAATNPCCRPAPHDAAQQLAEGKGRIEALREQLSNIEEELDSTPEQRAAKSTVMREQDRLRQLGDQFNEISSITID